MHGPDTLVLEATLVKGGRCLDVLLRDLSSSPKFSEFQSPRPCKSKSQIRLRMINFRHANIEQSARKSHYQVFLDRNYNGVLEVGVTFMKGL